MTSNDDSLLNAIGQILGDDHGLLREARERHAIDGLDFNPRCDMKQCARESAWTLECVAGCGISGVLCAGHHDSIVAENPWRSCGKCKVAGPVRNAFIFRPLGASS